MTKTDLPRPSASITREPAQKTPPPRRPVRSRTRWIIFAALIAAGVLFLLPFYWILVASLQPASMIFKTPPNAFPNPLTLDNYVTLLTSTSFPIWFLNSTLVALLHVLTVLPITAAAAYGFAKFRFRARNALFFYVLAFMMVPIQVLVVPLYIGFLKTGLANTYLPLILPWAATPFSIFLLRQWMIKIPDEILEAARVDGSSEFRIFRSIVIPLSMPAISTIVIIEFLWSWNNFFFPALVTTSNDAFTLPVGIASFVTNGSAGDRLYGPLAAASVLTIVPVVVVFVLLQRHFMAGILTAGVSK